MRPAGSSSIGTGFCFGAAASIAPLLEGSLEYRTREESGGKQQQQLIIAGTAGRDAIPPSSELSDGGCGSRMEDPEDDAVETTSQLLLL